VSADPDADTDADDPPPPVPPEVPAEPVPVPVLDVDAIAREPTVGQPELPLAPEPAEPPVLPEVEDV
jgi:hypothetical protein